MYTAGSMASCLAMHYVTMPNTVESLNKGHVGANSFVPCGEVIPISEVKVLAWCHNKYPL